MNEDEWMQDAAKAHFYNSLLESNCRNIKKYQYHFSIIYDVNETINDIVFAIIYILCDILFLLLLLFGF